MGINEQVAVIAPNIPAMYEAHLGVPMSGAVVNCVNIRLNAATVAFLLSSNSSFIHGAVLFADGGTDALVRPDWF